MGKLGKSVGSSNTWYGQCSDAQGEVCVHRNNPNQGGVESVKGFSVKWNLPKSEDRLESSARRKGAQAIDLGMKKSIGGASWSFIVAGTENLKQRVRGETSNRAKVGLRCHVRGLTWRSLCLWRVLNEVRFMLEVWRDRIAHDFRRLCQVAW